MGRGLIVLFIAAIVLSGASIAYAKPTAVMENGKTYFTVTSSDPTEDSGDEVCALMGMKCVGYTEHSTNVCKKAHPDAALKSDANGSKAGFYCNGAPQGGVCASEKNTCHICPNCNVNADCSTVVGDLYREMYVECVATSSPSVLTGTLKNIWGVPGRWWGAFRSAVARSFDLFRARLDLLTIKQIKHATIQIQGPNGTKDADIPVDSYVCEFYQTNKKMVTCGALAAADTFCTEAMQSRYARAALCEDNGVIVCSNPCNPPEKQIKPKMCAFDNDRSRGKQAPPLDFCTETVKIKVDMNMGTKRAGEVCKHGGECKTGICLGQPSDNGIKYFCSCSQTKIDTSCN